MATAHSTAFRANGTLADLVKRLGDVPLERIRLTPPPGTATERDVAEAKSRYGRICELVDGVLVEKTVGFYESLVAAALIELLGAYVHRRGLGVVAGPDGMMKILPRRVRVPDVSFVSWKNLPGGDVPDTPVPPLAPDLAVEVLSENNTPPEMKRKLREYFRAGVGMVWFIDHRTRTAEMYTSPKDHVRLKENGILDGGTVVPGFRVKLADLLARAEARRPKRRK